MFSYCVILAYYYFISTFLVLFCSQNFFLTITPSQCSAALGVAPGQGGLKSLAVCAAGVTGARGRAYASSAQARPSAELSRDVDPHSFMLVGCIILWK